MASSVHAAHGICIPRPVRRRRRADHGRIRAYPPEPRANFQAARPPVARSPADLPADPVAIRIAPFASGGGRRPATALEAVRAADARQHVRSGRLDQFSRSAETWRARTARRREARLLGGAPAPNGAPRLRNDRCRARIELPSRRRVRLHTAPGCATCRCNRSRGPRARPAIARVWPPARCQSPVSLDAPTPASCFARRRRRGRGPRALAAPAANARAAAPPQTRMHMQRQQMYQHQQQNQAHSSRRRAPEIPKPKPQAQDMSQAQGQAQQNLPTLDWSASLDPPPDRAITILVLIGPVWCGRGGDGGGTGGCVGVWVCGWWGAGGASRSWPLRGVVQVAAAGCRSSGRCVGAVLR